VSFFDTTPVGRIINRFSTDVTNVDAGLPAAFSTYLTFALRIVGTVTMQVGRWEGRTACIVGTVTMQVRRGTPGCVSAHGCIPHSPPSPAQAIILPWILLGLLLTAAIAIFVVGSYRASAREVKVNVAERVSAPLPV